MVLLRNNLQLPFHGKHRIWGGILIFALIAYSCSKNDAPDPTPERGEIASVSYLASYSAATLEALITGLGVEFEGTLSYSVDAYKFEYYTEDAGGNIVLASGAVVFPQNASDLPLLSLQHGTETRRDMVASAGPLKTPEGLVGLVGGALGFIVSMPDYLGLGSSFLLHPYQHAQSTANACVDLLRAVKIYCDGEAILLNDDLYIGGYSEGGYATLALHKAIETDHPTEFQITASAPLAGSYDLKGTVDSVLNVMSYPEPLFVAFLLTAYDDVYGWDRLDEIFIAPYASQVTTLFNGNYSAVDISAALPASIDLLVKEDFIDGYKNGTDQEVIGAFEENTLLDWGPVAPIRFYHSNGDEIVPYQNMITTAQNLRSNGATRIETVTIEGETHTDAAFVAIPMVMAWFDSLRVVRSGMY